MKRRDFCKTIGRSLAAAPFMPAVMAGVDTRPALLKVDIGWDGFSMWYDFDRTDITDRSDPYKGKRGPRYVELRIEGYDMNGNRRVNGSFIDRTGKWFPMKLTEHGMDYGGVYPPIKIEDLSGRSRPVFIGRFETKPPTRVIVLESIGREGGQLEIGFDFDGYTHDHWPDRARLHVALCTKDGKLTDTRWSHSANVYRDEPRMVVEVPTLTADVDCINILVCGDRHSPGTTVKVV